MLNSPIQSGPKEVRVSVRKIENGYVTEKCWDDKKGYHREEVFSEDPPDLSKGAFNTKSIKDFNEADESARARLDKAYPKQEEEGEEDESED